MQGKLKTRAETLRTKETTLRGLTSQLTTEQVGVYLVTNYTTVYLNLNLFPLQHHLVGLSGVQQMVDFVFYHQGLITTSTFATKYLIRDCMGKQNFFVIYSCVPV